MGVQLPARGWDCHVHVFDAGAPVAPGHYRPVHRPLAGIEALAQEQGFGHLVLVQPSVYGTDNGVLLEALRLAPGRHRGIVVLDDAVSEEDLRAMHSLGVRGIRYNLVSPVGNGGNPADQFRRLAPLLARLRWHVQWYARPQDLEGIAGLHEGTGIVAVLDHLAGLGASVRPSDDAWAAAARIASLGGWIKLSGWYRLGCAAPYEELDKAIRKALLLFGPRAVWGSDWPHTSFPPDALPAYTGLLAPVRRVLDASRRTQVFEDAPASLYA